MSNIVENLKKILTARYGKDVRQAIHDGIRDCYEDGKAGAIDMTARDAIQAEAVTRENEDNALDERVQALEAGGAGLSDLTYEAWVANQEQYEAEDKGYIVPMQEMTPEGEKIFLFDTNDIALDSATKSVLSSSTAGGAFREISSNLSGLEESKNNSTIYVEITSSQTLNHAFNQIKNMMKKDEGRFISIYWVGNDLYTGFAVKNHNGTLRAYYNSSSATTINISTY